MEHAKLFPDAVLRQRARKGRPDGVFQRVDVAPRGVDRGGCEAIQARVARVAVRVVLQLSPHPFSVSLPSWFSFPFFHRTVRRNPDTL